MRSVIVAALILSACNEEPKPAIQAPPTPAAAAPPVGPTMGPVAPGSYVNHVGNPAAGQWGPDGQWVWNNPESKEANDTWKYLAAAGAGAAGGAALSYMMSKKYFETRNPGGQWSRDNNVNDVQSYRDKRGRPISKEEYERRKAQSERDKQRHREQQRQLQAQQQPRDAQGRFIPKDPQRRAPERVRSAPPKKLNINRWNKKRRRK